MRKRSRNTTGISSLFVIGILFYSTPFVFSEYVIGSGPANYRPIQNAGEVARLNSLYQSGAITFEQYRARMNQLSHNLQTSRTADVIEIDDKATSPARSRAASNTTGSSGTSGQAQTRTVPANTIPSNEKINCAIGFTKSNLAVSVNNGPFYFSCYKDEYNASENSKVQTIYDVREDGVITLEKVDNDTFHFEYGSLNQIVYRPDGFQYIYLNMFLKDSDAMNQALQWAKSFTPPMEVTFAGVAPKKEDGYQVQVLRSKIPPPGK